MSSTTEVTEEQRQRAEANRLAALAKRKALTGSASSPDAWKLFKCRKVSPVHNPSFRSDKISSSVQKPHNTPPPPPPEKFKARLEICSPDSFAITPVPVQGSPFIGEAACLEKLSNCLSNVIFSHFTQNHGGTKSCVYKIRDYDAVRKCLKSYKDIEIEEIPWTTLNVVGRLSHSFVDGQWTPCRPDHLSDEEVDELIRKLPKKLVESLLPFQLEGVKFGLRRGGRCLIADEMGLGKTLQAITIASCFISEGPILVVCPAILRYSWAEELERWLPSCVPSDIHLVFGHHSNPANLKKRPRVVVISYTMLNRLRKSMLDQEWALLVVDESHHLRCSKKASETGEIQAVLDMATKINRIVLLSGTPSLSRPFDIFHQMNIVWPGLLGKSKFDFAKTYCSMQFRRGCQGKVFQDFSRGVRLEELNVLLKQAVMIRRLKKHVLEQLPPLRRQIISLHLKKSDITLAVISAKRSSDESNDNSGGEPLHITADTDDSPGCSKPLSELSSQEIGIAKLSGFQEWLSMHPIFSESDSAENMELSLSSHKMIIFGHHHRVLDGVQEFVCDKGIQFVRIDGNTSSKDRQLAVASFQSSKEVKIAIIGIKAGGVGIELTSAQHVVFLELPQTQADMAQAEGRAHRKGQTEAVNVYLFCAKDTRDESHWQGLNKSLHRVSCTTDGKYGAIEKIEIDNVSYLEATGISGKPTSDGEISSGVAAVETMPCPNLNSPCSKQQADMSCGMLNDDNCNAKEDLEADSSPAKTESFEIICSQVPGDECDYEDDLAQRDDLAFGRSELSEAETSGSSLHAEHLRFEVSQYTGRIHLYSCIPGIDTRPRPLSENFLPDDLESSDLSARNTEEVPLSIKYNPIYRPVLLEFVKEWNDLKPMQKNRLLAKPLQLPLSVELCCLNENLNHDSGGLLKGTSKRRNTPLDEINLQLPSNAEWKVVQLLGGRGKKERVYSQAWTVTGEPLCKLCQTPCQSKNATKPEFFEDLFCNLGCYEEYRIRTSNTFLRQELFQVERGICTNCQLNCHKLVQHIKPLSQEKRLAYIQKVAPKLAVRKKLVDKLVSCPTEGNAWHADHIIPVYLGGGECRIENLRTLCVACHADVTAAQCAQRRSERAQARKQLKAIMSAYNATKESERIGSNLKDQNHQESIVEDELLVTVPGSAYTGAAKDVTVEDNLESFPEGQDPDESGST